MKTGAILNAGIARLVFVTGFSVLFFACGTGPYKKPVTEKDKEDALTNACFQDTIIANLERYRQLKDLLVQNLDTIIGYRDAKGIIQVSPNGPVDTIYEKHDCYNYYLRSAADDNIESIPEFLREPLNRTSQTAKCLEFEICKSKKVVLGVGDGHARSYLIVIHSLIWNPDSLTYYYEDKFRKDTMLAPDCLYRIDLSVNYGFW